MGPTNPDISVIITVFNGDTTILNTLNSIKGQTFKNYEIVIVNDGSTDNTKNVLENFKIDNKDLNIKIYNMNSMGRSKALNFALNKARSPYIANLDADDLWEKRHLDIQLNNIKENSEFGLICTNFSLIIGNDIDNSINLIENISNKIIDITHKVGRYNPVNHSSVIYKKKVIQDLGGYNENFNKLIDYELWVRLRMNKIKIGYFTGKTCIKRIHENQNFENKKPYSYALSIFKLSFKALVSEKDYFGILFVLLKFLYGLFPQIIRQKLKKMILNK
ncbi:glycosyltransferase family 2 protein [Metabacillus sp. 113a]|uniref:glycosyltransferase family 2 protein n=1 Tax=Metabacillus sp. 113a TaxID=3404706 RepID=UPI003CEA0883